MAGRQVRLHLTAVLEGVVRCVGVEWVVASEGRQAKARTDFHTKPSTRGKGRLPRPPQQRLTFRLLPVRTPPPSPLPLPLT